MTESLQVQLRKGVLELCVLSLLAKTDRYAYEIAARLAAEIGMGEGTIYPLMRRLQGEGWVRAYLIESSSGPARKYYKLTPAGRTALESMRSEWEGLLAGVEGVLREAR